MNSEIAQRDLQDVGFEPVAWTDRLIDYLRQKGWTQIRSPHPGAVLAFRDLRVVDRSTTVSFYTRLDQAAHNDDFRDTLVQALFRVAEVEGRNWVWVLRDVAAILPESK